jgi:asparagine synthase (glutamine-hydrolysing)
MCGIAGILSLDGAPVTGDHVEGMVRAIAHRGPDAQGFHVDGPCALGHARLSIIDVAGGHQPMTNEDGSLWLTFNGEIFNYVELRHDLEKRGHRFSTSSDTEVILHLYEEKGDDCVHDLNGQWAFGLWDNRKRRLFLSRDRIGVRPLYYTTTATQFLFASEMKALCVHPGVRREIDLEVLDQIFTFWAPLAPRTILKHVSELPPGHSLSVDANGQRLQAYWRPSYRVDDRLKNADACADELLDLLTDATRIRLRSDVPVGAYLSGGIDSSVITALVNRLATDRLRTFSVTFDESEFDESGYQDDVVGYLNTEHSRVRCSNADIGEVFQDVVWHAERPIVRTAPAPLYLLSKLVRDSGYKVVLTGEGADEMLGGYDIFKEAKIRAFWASQPDSTRRPQLLKRLYPYLQNVQSQPDAFLQAFFRVGSGTSNCFFSHLPRWQMTARMKILLSGDAQARLASYDSLAELKASLPGDFETWDWFSRAQYLETAVLLPGYILSSQGDRVAMAHAVEGRFPFLDHRVVKFAASIPPALKMKVLKEKYILKRAAAAANLVPANVTRRSKQPYRAPEAVSFVTPNRRGHLPEYVETLLASDRVARDGVFNPVAVTKLMAKVRAGRAIGIRDNMSFVAVLSTQLVIDRFINRAA